MWQVPSFSGWNGRWTTSGPRWRRRTSRVLPALSPNHSSSSAGQELGCAGLATDRRRTVSEGRMDTLAFLDGSWLEARQSLAEPPKAEATCLQLRSMIEQSIISSAIGFPVSLSDDPAPGQSAPNPAGKRGLPRSAFARVLARHWHMRLPSNFSDCPDFRRHGREAHRANRPCPDGKQHVESNSRQAGDRRLRVSRTRARPRRAPA